MGSHVHLVLYGSDADVRWAEREIMRLEQRWSRFLGCSDVSRCNRAAGRGAVVVAPETLELIADACDWSRATEGWFDPTVLRALEANGYDAPFSVVRERATETMVIKSNPPGRPAMRIPAVARRQVPRPAPGCADIEIDRMAGTVALPNGVGIDLGGIGKGATADHIATGLAARGVPAACVSMGGDVRAFGNGHSAGGRGWDIPVEDPLDEAHTMFTHNVNDGAIVTTTSRFRRWTRDGHVEHHLVDPTTGRTADTGLVAVVVADRSAARAEVLAKAAFVAGSERGAELLARFNVDGWFVKARELVGAHQ